MKKIFFLIISILSFQALSLADNIQYFQIEGMKIGDSALDYFSESQLEDNEQGWHNYSYNEYSTSYIPGKGIYNWFLVSYKNDDSKFIIEGLVGVEAAKSLFSLIAIPILLGSVRTCFKVNLPPASTADP